MFVSTSQPAPRARSAIRPADFPLPFGGLGFDLAPVVRRAAGLRLTPLARTHAPVVSRPRDGAAWRLAGYALLLSICRETGGR